MKSDLRLNFGVLEDIAEKTMKYKESLETVKEVLENVNNKIDENEGKAIDELRKGYKDINEDLDRCLEEVDDIYDIMNRYTDEMQSIITPKKKNDIMRVDRTDIWWNQQSIMEACQSVQFLRWNISTYRSFINPFADDDVVENEENNYNKMKCIWDEINSCGYKLSSYVDEMNRLFNSKIVVFENRDDDYKGEVKSRLYDKYTSGFERFIDVGSDTINFVIDTVRGFSMSIYDMLVGIVNLCKSIICLPGSAVAFVYDKITGEVPDCLKDSYEYEKNFLGGISSVVKDPTLLVEGIAQGVSDAYEEEGIAYCFGYGAGEVAQFVVGSKLASKLKGGKVKSSAFGYMDADDALRYNQYWDDVAKGLYNNPYGGKLSLDEISRMQCGFDKIAQKNWEYELGLDRYNNRILDYHNENPINNAIKGVGQAKFKYKNNPSDSPKVLLDAVEDSNAVYGYRPNDTGSLKKFVKYDWTDSDVVAKFRENRLRYHIENDGYRELVNSMRADGHSDVEIAKTLVEKRNANRLSSYIDENGKISDIELYNQAKEHCVTYEQLKHGINGKPGKSDLQIIESAMKGNEGMDACCGLYDDYYYTYK